MRHIFNSKQRFSIRKYHFGAASVLIGTVVSLGFMGGTVQAEESQLSNPGIEPSVGSLLRELVPEEIVIEEEVSKEVGTVVEEKLSAETSIVNEVEESAECFELTVESSEEVSEAEEADEEVVEAEETEEATDNSEVNTESETVETRSSDEETAGTPEDASSVEPFAANSAVTEFIGGYASVEGGITEYLRQQVGQDANLDAVQVEDYVNRIKYYLPENINELKPEEATEALFGAITNGFSNEELLVNNLYLNPTMNHANAYYNELASIGGERLTADRYNKYVNFTYYQNGEDIHFDLRFNDNFHLGSRDARLTYFFTIPNSLEAPTNWKIRAFDKSGEENLVHYTGENETENFAKLHESGGIVEDGKGFGDFFKAPIDYDDGIGNNGTNFSHQPAFSVNYPLQAIRGLPNSREQEDQFIQVVKDNSQENYYFLRTHPDASRKYRWEISFDAKLKEDNADGSQLFSIMVGMAENLPLGQSGFEWVGASPSNNFRNVTTADAINENPTLPSGDPQNSDFEDQSENFAPQPTSSNYTIDATETEKIQPLTITVNDDSDIDRRTVKVNGLPAGLTYSTTFNNNRQATITISGTPERLENWKTGENEKVINASLSVVDIHGNSNSIPITVRLRRALTLAEQFPPTANTIERLVGFPVTVEEIRDAVNVDPQAGNVTETVESEGPWTSDIPSTSEVNVSVVYTDDSIATVPVEVKFVDFLTTPDKGDEENVPMPTEDGSSFEGELEYPGLPEFPG
ncbi:YSIRK-type signal peptide-containing protein, partial [Eremococcus coleocola]|uniref:YSIRK-type signal peptide-containing protein n=1 Tax=Eremococcus coleocola TaxID=88132 RepID=UPI00054DB125